MLLDGKSSWNNTVKKITAYLKDIKNAAHMVESIVIPFADKIKVPNNLEMRRDFDKILDITAVIAFINFRNRDRLQNKTPEQLLCSVYGETEPIHKGVIIARPEDYVVARDIAGSSIKRTINKASLKTREIFEVLKKLANESTLEDTGISLKQITETLGKYPETTVRDHLKTLRNNGFVIRDETTREFRYFPIDKKFNELTNTSINYTPEAYLEWLKQVLEPHTHSFVSSLDSPISSDLCLKTPKEVAKTPFDSSRKMEKFS